ncbi:MAG: hypothetical protein ABFD62_06580 [Syntrophaceae bacterium]
MGQSEKININRIRKWQKRIMVILGIIIVGISIIHFSDSRTKVERDFEKALEKFVESGEKRILLRFLTDFKWDRVYVFGPYGDDGSWKGEHPLTDEGHWGLQFIDMNNNYIPIRIRRGLLDEPRQCGCFLKDVQLVYHGERDPYSANSKTKPEFLGTRCND